MFDFKLIPEAPTSAHELRRTAYHEASQKVMIEMLGGTTDAFVWRSVTGNPDHTPWCGTCVPKQRLGTYPVAQKVIDISNRASVPRNATVLVGLAGIVGELLQEISDDDEIYNEFVNKFQLDEVSPTDLAIIGVDVTSIIVECEFETVLALLKSAWQSVEANAKSLMEFAEQAEVPDLHHGSLTLDFS